MIHFNFRVFDVNCRDFEEGHSELMVFYRFHVSAAEKHKVILYLYIYICYILIHFSLSNLSHIQNKQYGRRVHIVNDSIPQSREITKNLSAQY